MKDSLLFASLAGFAVFAASQYVLKLVLEPIVALRKTLSEISSTLLFHQAAITNGVKEERIARKLKQLSASLRSGTGAIFLYRFLAWTRLFGVPKKDDVSAACRELNGMSHRSQHDMPNENSALANVKALQVIKTLLKIETTY